MVISIGNNPNTCGTQMAQFRALMSPTDSNRKTKQNKTRKEEMNRSSPRALWAEITRLRCSQSVSYFCRDRRLKSRANKDTITVNQSIGKTSDSVLWSQIGKVHWMQSAPAHSFCFCCPLILHPDSSLSCLI